MQNRLPSYVVELLRCPFCLGHLTEEPNAFKCTSCDQVYPHRNDQPDLRLRQCKKVQLQFELGAEVFPDNKFDFEPLSLNPSPEVNFDSVKAPVRLTRAQMSYIPKAKSPESLVLDLGCGHTFHKPVLDYAGYKYVGFDYDEQNAPMLGDAHALPFPDNTFDFILSIAVLEHIINPFVMMKETLRVLKPGGKLLGTVAFLEPFHANSCYHHTHLGTYYTLHASGFRVLKVAPSPDWPVLVAQSGLLFSKMPSLLRKSIVMPVHFLHKLWWKAASFANPKANRKNRILFMTGSFTFLAEKP